jgi:hypothetical protein
MQPARPIGGTTGVAPGVGCRAVPNWDDVRSLVRELPDTAEQDLHGQPSWRVHGKLFVWARPLRRSDLAELGDAAPDGPILGARVDGLAAKQALLADPSGVYFTTSHFDGHPSVLVRLPQIPADELRELVVEAWLARAPKRLAREWAADHLPRDGA